MRKLFLLVGLCFIFTSTAFAESRCELVESNDPVRESGVDDGGGYFHMDLICTDAQTASSILKIHDIDGTGKALIDERQPTIVEFHRYSKQQRIVEKSNLKMKLLKNGFAQTGCGSNEFIK